MGKPMTGTDSHYSELEYTAGYYHELGPAHLRFCALVAGVEGGAAPTTYLELGMGQGVSLAVHAAANEGDFWGVDINPVHVTHARALADAIGGRVSLSTQSFSEFAARDDLPVFDVITLHGVWSWVSDASRRVIVELIRDRLAPGGLVYLSYNCMPGWAARGPVRHLLKLGHAAHPDDGPEARIKAAMTLAEEVAAADSRFFGENRPAASHLASLRKAPSQYLGHEYLNADWYVPYVSDVAEALAGANLAFVSSARLLDRVNAIQLQPQGVALLDRTKDPIVRELVRDFLVNQQFRPDIFARDAFPLSAEAVSARWDAQAFVLACGLDEIDFHLTGAQGEMILPETIYRPLALALAEEAFRPRTLLDLMSTTGVSALAPLRRGRRPHQPGRHGCCPPGQGLLARGASAMRCLQSSRAGPGGDRRAAGSPGFACGGRRHPDSAIDPAVPARVAGRGAVHSRNRCFGLDGVRPDQRARRASRCDHDDARRQP